MCVEVVVGVLCMLHDSRAIRVEVVFRVVIVVRPDGVDTAGELPCLVYLRYLYFATIALGDLLAPLGHRYRH